MQGGSIAALPGQKGSKVVNQPPSGQLASLRNNNVSAALCLVCVTVRHLKVTVVKLVWVHRRTYSCFTCSLHFYYCVYPVYVPFELVLGLATDKICNMY